MNMHISFINHHDRAPERRFPYALNDCFDTLRWASAKHIYIHVVMKNWALSCSLWANVMQCRENAASIGADASKVILNGSSAGGNLVGHFIAQRVFHDSGF